MEKISLFRFCRRFGNPLESRARGRRAVPQLVSMPPLTGKNAILAAARRLAERGDDDFDEDLLDAELALAGPLFEEEEDETDDEDAEGAVVIGEITGKVLDVNALGLPPRLTKWLTKHTGRDMRVAFGAASRAAARLNPDRDGHVKLGRALGIDPFGNEVMKRTKYKPLEERVVPVSKHAAPTPRPFEYVSPLEMEKIASLTKQAQTETQWRRGERAFTKNNACTNPAVQKIMKNSFRREREVDLPKGAGPAGRHEPTTRNDPGQAAVMGKSLLDLVMEPGSDELKRDTQTSEKLTAAQRRLFANALLSRLPKDERPILPTSHETAYGGLVGKNASTKVPRTTRQATLDFLVTAALVGEAKQRGVCEDDVQKVVTEQWLLARPKTRAKAIAAGVDAESRVHDQATSTLSYRGLASNALRVVGVVVVPGGDAKTETKDSTQETRPEGTAEEAGGSGCANTEKPSDAAVRPLAALFQQKSGSVIHLSPADSNAVVVALAFESKAKLVVEKQRKGVGGVAFATPGSLLQNYENGVAAKIDLRSAREVRGTASTSFWKRTLVWQFPPITTEPNRDAIKAEVTRRRNLFAGEDTGNPPAANKRFLSPEKKLEPPAAVKKRKTEPPEIEPQQDVHGNALVTTAVQNLIKTFLEPFLDVGSVTHEAAVSITRKATLKVMAKKASEKNAEFLTKEKERSAVQALVREYVRRGVEVGSAAKRQKSKGEQKPAVFDFDVADL